MVTRGGRRLITYCRESALGQKQASRMFATLCALLLGGILVLGGGIVSVAQEESTDWMPIAVGVDRAHTTLPSGDAVVMVRINIDKANLRVVDVRNEEGVGQEADRVAEKGNHVLAANAGFFDIDRTPMGLLISDGVEIQGIREVDWGVFFLDEDGAHIVHTKEYAPTKAVLQAIQTGPRLVVGGKPTKLKAQSARRTAIGICPGNHVLLLVAPSPLEATSLAQAFVDHHCSDALNLDGGPSTQLTLGDGQRWEHIEGGTAVPTMLVVDAVALPADQRKKTRGRCNR